MSQFQIDQNKKVFIASDFHLGVPDSDSSLVRERKIIRWLDQISDEAGLIILAGDIFDFWFEYKHVVPKNQVRFLGKIAELRDRNIPIIFFAGNHDMWFFDYFPTVFDIPVYRKPKEFEFFNKTYFVGHGDGLGPGDRKYKIIKKFFSNPFFQWCFSWLHPNIGYSLANGWSARSKQKSIEKGEPFVGEDERIFKYCKKKESEKHRDFYVFGHRHLVLEMPINETSKYINLGEWINQCAYLEISEEETKLLYFEN